MVGVEMLVISGTVPLSRGWSGKGRFLPKLAGVRLVSIETGLVVAAFSGLGLVNWLVGVVGTTGFLAGVLKKLETWGGLASWDVWLSSDGASMCVSQPESICRFI